jgi:hypothetical protein
MSHDRLEQIEALRLQLEAKTKLCEVLAHVIPADSPSRALLNRLRELGEDHIAFGSALRRFADATDIEGDACAI